MYVGKYVWMCVFVYMCLCVYVCSYVCSINVTSDHMENCDADSSSKKEKTRNEMTIGIMVYIEC